MKQNSVNDVQQRYGVKRSTVHIWIHRGLLIASERFGKALAFTEADLRRFERRHTIRRRKQTLTT